MEIRLRHPGRKVAAAFEGLSQSAAAACLGMTRQTVNRLYQGRQAITPAMALRLEAVSALRAEEWLGLQMKYELDKLRNEGLAECAHPDVRHGHLKQVRVVVKQASRIADLQKMRSGVPPAVIQEKNAAFDGRRYHIKSRVFKG